MQSIPLARAVGAAVLVSLSLLAGNAVAQHQPAADPVGLRGDLGGNWHNPARSGQGLMVDVLDRGRAVVSWYTFDANGAPMWLFGLATIEGHRVRVPASTVAGGRFPTGGAGTPQVQPWGELLLEFTGCNDATLSWTPVAAGFSAGSMPLQRLTSLQGERCNAEEEFGETREFSFERGTLGFEALFADRPPGEDAFYELDYQYEPLPPPLAARRGVRLSGNNHSDDLAMLVKAPLRGLRTDALYRVEIDLELASNIPTGCAGIGGSPGDSVYLKLGATTAEPLASSIGQPDGWLRLNFDFGQQAESGEQGKVVGTLANSYSCDDGTQAPWELKTVSTQGQVLRARTDAEGTLWIVAGSDSAFEGRSDWYLTALRVRLEAIDDASTP